MAQIIDRRLNGKHKSAENRQRFLKRFRAQLKKSAEKIINKRSITDVESSEKVTIPIRDTKEYHFQHGKGGIRDIILPGNKDFLPGDKISRPEGQSQGKGSEASQSGEGLDDFVFEISSEEFLDLFFEDLALPDLVKKELATIPAYKYVHAGYTTTGVPTNINIVRSLKGAMSRKIALTAPYNRQVKFKLQELEKLQMQQENSEEINLLTMEIEKLKHKIRKIPFIDTFDLRYNNRLKQHVPSTQAVMFCMMDVSGSMDRMKKDIAKRFFILLYLFLKRNYEKIDVVFIRHHTSAKEVDEQEFFYSRETGGTVVSSALSLSAKILQERYNPLSWNIYCAQASDGDNWNADSPHCGKILLENLMPYTQYYAYIEIMPRLHQSLWDIYLTVKKQFPNFSMQTIHSIKDIYPVFRELFKRQV